MSDVSHAEIPYYSPVSHTHIEGLLNLAQSYRGGYMTLQTHIEGLLDIEDEKRGAT
jgi:hypothetical protein